MNILPLSPRLLLLLALGSVLPVGAQSLVVRGSDTLLPLSRAWAEAYSAKHPGFKIDSAGGGAPAAFNALAQKQAGLVLVSRSMRYPEAEACTASLGQRPAEFKVGVNGLAIFVNASNPVKLLSYDELYAVFKGSVKNWKDLGGADAPILALGLDTNTPAGELFVEEVLNGKGLGAEVRILSEVELFKTLLQEKNGIAFGPFQQREGLRPLAIKRSYSSTPVEPSPETISNRIYPITRFLFSYLGAGASAEETQRYIGWLRGEDAQQVVQRLGFFPLPAKWRASP